MRSIWQVVGVVVVAGLTTGSALAQGPLVGHTRWPGTSGGNDRVYALTSVGSSWTAAEAFAVASGGRLVSINTAAESEFIRQTFLTGAAASEDFWVGLTAPEPGDFLQPSNWVWSDGSPVDLVNWAPGEPDAGFGVDRYAAINFVGGGSMLWHNYPDTGFRAPRAIVELDTCGPADVAAPYGVLNFFDVSAYLGLFQTGSLDADLAAPFGVLNFFDVSAYLGHFVPGCQ